MSVRDPFWPKVPFAARRGRAGVQSATVFFARLK
jgi:hypothetical protein